MFAILRLCVYTSWRTTGSECLQPAQFEILKPGPVHSVQKERHSMARSLYDRLLCKSIHMA